MAKLVFLQLNDYELHGLESISAVLKSRGHEVELVIAGMERDPMVSIIRHRPHVVGLGHATVERTEALAWAKALKARTGAKVVMGGVDPTFHPDNALAPGVDAVCRGEAELTMAEIMDRVEAGQDFADLDGLAAARDGQLRVNPMRPRIPDLDSLPLPDKRLYLARYPYFRSHPVKQFLASRGCPHQCTYCANRGLRGLYPDPEHYVRFKSPDYLLREIKETLNHYSARTIGFGDDLFTLKQSWMEEFLPKFKRDIGLPFYCCARIDTMNDEKARLLKDSGCYNCWYGLESANPQTRELVLGRRMSNEKIKEGAAILRRHGIPTQTYNIMNIPGETLEDGLNTLRFNRELDSKFVVASLFQPFPGTELAARLIAEGKLKEPEALADRERLSYFAFSPFEQADTKKLTNLQKFFILGNWFPSLIPLIGKLCSLPGNPLFDILFLGAFAIDYGRSHRMSSWEVARYNLRHLWTTYLARSRKAPEQG